MTQTVPVINSGSSSIKYQFVDPEAGEAIIRSLVKCISNSLGNIKYVHGDEIIAEELPISDYEIDMCEVLHLSDMKGLALDGTGIIAVGHRIVQGDEYFDGPTFVTDEVRDLIEQLCPMAPLHSPAHLKGIGIVHELMPDVPHVAVLDTAFLQQLPDKTATYVLGAKIAKKCAVRRYGAHGTSHQFASQEVAKRLGRDDLKQIVMHLGNGTSVSAAFNSKLIDISMGLTPLEDLMVGTHTDDIDPTVVFHLARQGDSSIDEIDRIFNRKSGIKDLTGESDMRSVWASIRDGSEPELRYKARVAMDIYVNRLLKYVGSYATELSGLDAMSFIAGIDENDSDVRRELAEALAPFGMKIDVEKSELRSNESLVTSVPDSRVPLLISPTNEELAITRQALSII